MSRYHKDYSIYEYLEGWEKLTIGEQLNSWSVMYQDRIAIEEAENTITYRELDDRSNQMAFGLLDVGLKQGDNAVIQLPNRISFVITFFALVKIGVLPVLALPAHREGELDGIIGHSKAVAYIIPDCYLGFSYRDMAVRLKQKHLCLKHIIVDSEESGELELSSISGVVRPFKPLDCYAPAFLSLSGGTTGIPKLIPRTHSDYMYGARRAAIACEITSEDVYLAILPVAHNFILGHPGMLGTLMHGGKVVLSKTTSPDEALPLIGEKQVTITSLVPAMVKACMEMLEWDDSIDMSSLKVLQVGGSMLEEVLADKIISNWDCKLQQIFGTAEGLNTMTSLNDPDWIVKQCQGKAISPADEVKIVDEDGREVLVGEYGELITRGPYTIDGYYQAPDVNCVSFTDDGFYRTGDRAMITPEGNLRMGGRIKEQINRAGEKVMPAEVERYLSEYEKITASAVLGVPDDDLGERTVAFVMTNGEEINLQQLHQFLEQRGLSKYKMPDQLEVIDLWPLTSVGKIDKKQLKIVAQQK